MPLLDLITTLRTDLADPSAELLSNAVLERCLRKGVYRLGRDLGVLLAIRDGEVVPTLSGERTELLILLGEIHACQVMRAATANNFSFSSGDKRVDKTGQPKNWADLEEDLTATYRQRLAAIMPGSDPDAYIITPQGLRPTIYEQGIDLDLLNSPPGDAQDVEPIDEYRTGPGR